MRRRRRPPIRRQQNRRSANVNPGAQKLLRRAHHLMEKGDHKSASNIFERLARGAEDRGLLRPAPNLYLQAARANLLAGEENKVENLLMHGLKIFAKTQRWSALARSGQRILSELQNLGHSQAADNISDWLNSTLPEPIESYKFQQKVNPRLPLKCPNCGGALRPDEVEFLDDITGECPYCGSAVREG